MGCLHGHWITLSTSQVRECPSRALTVACLACPCGTVDRSEPYPKHLIYDVWGVGSQAFMPSCVQEAEFLAIVCGLAWTVYETHQGVESMELEECSCLHFVEFSPHKL